MLPMRISGLVDERDAEVHVSLGFRVWSLEVGV